MRNTRELRMKLEPQVLQRVGIPFLFRPGEIVSVDCDLFGLPPSQRYTRC